MKDEIKVEFLDGSFKKGKIIDVNTTFFGKTEAIKIEDNHGNHHVINLTNVLYITYYNDKISF